MNPTTNQTTGIICILAFVIIGSMLYIWFSGSSNQDNDSPAHLYSKCVSHKINTDESINDCGYILNHA